MKFKIYKKKENQILKYAQCEIENQHLRQVISTLQYEKLISEKNMKENVFLQEDLATLKINNKNLQNIIIERNEKLNLEKENKHLCEKLKNLMSMENDYEKLILKISFMGENQKNILEKLHKEIEVKETRISNLITKNADLKILVICIYLRHVLPQSGFRLLRERDK